MEEDSPFHKDVQQTKDVRLPPPYQQRDVPNRELRESIDQDGLNSPVIVREVPKEKVSNLDTLLPNLQIVSNFDPYYELIAGHNRTNMFREMGRATIPESCRS